MSVVFSGTNQGRFVSTGNAQIIQLRSDVDWMYVRNENVSYAGGADTGAEFYWQRGMAQGRGTIYTKLNADDSLKVSQIAANSGFYLIDSSVNVPGPSLALTGITNANPPLVNTAATASLNNGDIVRIFSTVGALQLGGIDFTIGNINAGVSYELAYMAQIANANPGAGTFRRIPFDPIYYPRNRYITKITQAATAVVTLSVTHNYVVGQIVRFVVPRIVAARYGMNELDGMTGTIIAVGDPDADGILNTITVDIDTSAFTAFVFPVTADPGFTPAQVIPCGSDTAEMLTRGVSTSANATVNTGYIGIQLKAGNTSPAGTIGDVIYWVAGKSFSVNN